MRHAVAVRPGEEQAARATIDLAEYLAGLADDRRVDDRHHLGEVVHHEAIEENLVGVLQVAQEDVPVDLGFAGEVRLAGPCHLFLEGFLVGGEKAEEAERAALGLGEGGALVVEGFVEEFATAKGIVLDFHGCCLSRRRCRAGNARPGRRPA